MKAGKTIGLILAISMLMSVAAYAADSGAGRTTSDGSETDTVAVTPLPADGETASAERASTSAPETENGMAGCIVLGGHNGQVRLEGVELTGSVLGAAQGVHMTLDGDSCWTVTGESQLDRFSLAEGAEVRAAEGQSLAIYVDCAMDSAGSGYDAATGSRIRAFVPGVEYSGVVIQLVEQTGEDSGDLFAALGIGTAVVDGEYGVSVVELLEALGVSVTVDEATGAIVVDDPDGVLRALIDGEAE